MKKLTVLLMCLIICMCAISSPVTAERTVYTDSNVEIQFEENNFTEEQIEKITNALLSGTEDEQSAKGILCIFGHDYESTIVTKITHNVYATYPKCKQETHKVSACTRCDKTKTELLTTEIVACCE